MARPRKPVLLYCSNEQTMSVIRCVINNLSKAPYYTVHSATTVDQAIQFIEDKNSGFFDAAIIVHSSTRDAARRLDGYLQANTDIPSIWLTESAGNRELYQSSMADASFPFGAPVAAWLERLRILSVRKRGPKKVFNNEPVPPLRSHDLIA